MRPGMLLCAGLLLCGTTAAQSIEALREALEEIRREARAPAIGLAVVSAGEVRYADAWGVADVASGRAADAGTVFRVGSITKTFTALAAMLLAQDGRLQLEDRLRDRVPARLFHNPWANEHPLRIVHLLEHTGGLLDLTREEFDHDVPLPLAEALSKFAEHRVLRWPPGLHMEYSNAGYGLAGLAIERAAGEPYEAFVERRLLAPLGMRDSGFAPHPRLATGYEAGGRAVIPYWHMVFRPFGALNATVGDMAAFVQFLLRAGSTGDGVELLPAAVIARMERPVSTLAARAGLAYGYGLGIDQWSRRGFVFHGHGGDGDGYLARYGYNRELDAGYFVVINAFDKPTLRRLQRLIEDALIGHAPAPPPPPAGDVSTAALERLTGTYEAVTWRFSWEGERRARLRVIADDAALVILDEHGERRALVPAGGDARFFRRVQERVATVAFVHGPDGALYLQGDFGNYRRLD